MIVFQTSNNHKIDLSKFNVSLTEESSLFTDNIYKSYSVPFTIPAEEELLEKLGLPQLDNITDVNTSVRGKLLLPYTYYDAILFLGEIEGSQIECSLSFGDQELPVYDRKLKDLPWPVQLITQGYTLEFAGKVANTWPTVPYNFPRVYDPSIKDKSGYESFKGFINNNTGIGPVFNEVDNSGEEPVYHNYNVLAPFPYLLEILRFGYAQEGKTISGELFEDEIMKQALYIPENFLEKFRGSEYTAFSFSTPSEVQSQEIGIYERRFTPEKIGTYEVDYKLNIDPVTAAFFEFSIYQEDPLQSYKRTILFEASSTNNRVRLSEKLKINVTSETQFHPIVIEMKLNYKADSIAGMNQFEYSYAAGKLNEFPSSFSLADFVPDMTFGEYVNELKNWLNLDIDVQEGKVEINYTQNSILKKQREDHKHLEIPNPKKKHNSNRFYKLNYANGEQVFYNSNGQVFSELDEKGADVITIEMDVQPAVVEQNKDVITAVVPENRSGIDFCLFKSPGSLVNDCAPEIARELSQQKNFDKNWSEWLRYRVHSKTFKENFECSVHERININELSFKYNELHIIKKLQRKFLSEKVMRVDLESETF